MNNKIIKLIIITIILTGFVDKIWANDTIWPKIEKYNNSNICLESFKLALASFNSDNFNIDINFVLPRNSNIKLIIKPSSPDISNDDDLIADKNIFQQISNNNYGLIYWQIKSNYGLRYIVTENSFGWRGNQYQLFAINENMPSDEFLDIYVKENKKLASSLIIDMNWIPPLILKNQMTDEIWAIDVGSPYNYLSNWTIYEIYSEGIRKSCTIKFHPNSKSVIDLLPKAVQTLAVILDQTLVNGHNEGTLQLTARKRIAANHIWANIALRPWALPKAKSINGLQYLDADLKKIPHNLKELNKIYSEAERELARYYNIKFAKNTKYTDEMAKHALYFVFKSYFDFLE